MAQNTTKVKYLIIGNSAGGIGAAEAIREVDQSGSLAIVSDERIKLYPLAVNGRFLTQKITGAQRVVMELCKQIKELDIPIAYY